MVTFLEGVRESINAFECGVLAAQDYVSGAVGRLAPGIREQTYPLIERARRFRGCDPLGDPTPPPPPFTGGQCPGVTYTYTRTVISAEGVAGNPQTVGCGALQQGPIGLRRVPFGEDGVSWFLTFTRNNGEPRESLIVTSNSQVTVVLSNLSRCDGQPDSCGDPAPDFPPPTNIEVDIDVTYNIDDGSEVTITLPFVFAPFTVDFNGDINIPFTFDFGGNEFSGRFNLNPSFPVTINFPQLPPGNTPGIEDEPPDAPGESVEPADPDQKIIGVVVTATTIQQGKISSYSSPGIPEIYVPRLGSVKFVYNLGGATFFSSDIDVKDRRTFIECPFAGGADAVIASPQLGVDFSFLAIRGFPQATTGDLARLG